MNKKSKGFAPILILIILVAIAVAGYLILKPLLTPSLPPPSPSPTPTPSVTEESGQPEQTVKDNCKVTGCEGEICADESYFFPLLCAVVIPPDSCYLKATCERQENGECDWTQTEELKRCIYGNTDPNDAQRKTDIYMLRNALEQYKIEVNNLYPASLQTLISENFLKEIPQDPVTGKSYAYQVSANKLDYTITATLENGSLYQMGPP